MGIPVGTKVEHRENGRHGTVVVGDIEGFPDTVVVLWEGDGKEHRKKRMKIHRLIILQKPHDTGDYVFNLPLMHDVWE